MVIRTAIIGLGIMGRRMAEHMALHEAFSVDAIWDPDADACRLASDIVPGATVTDTAEAAIVAADLVYLACPPVPRKAYALAAAKAGKAVYLEKPLGVDIEQSRDLVAALSASGVPAAVNFTQAAGDALAELTSALGSEELARRVIESHRDYELLASRDRRNVDRLSAEMQPRRVIKVPYLDDEIHDLAGLAELNRYLFASGAEREALAVDVAAG